MPMPDPNPRRRQLLALSALPLLGLGACSTPLPLPAAAEDPAPSDPAAERLLQASAAEHGAAAYAGLRDINVRYEGSWRPLIHRIQPVIVDREFRGWSEERLMPHEGLVAQAFSGPAGRKQVVWQRPPGRESRGQVAVWFNGQRNTQPEPDAAAALVAEAYGLFLLGPLWLAGRGHRVQMGEPARVHGRACQQLQLWKRPGLGWTPLDRVALFIDAEQGICRRLRFTLEGFANTRGAVAEVDCFEHQRRFGLLWPMRSYEEVVHPIRLPAHDWQIAGLDVNRGYAAAELQGPQFTGAAAAPAAAV